MVFKVTPNVVGHPGLSGLSEQDIRILQLVAEGHTNSRIARHFETNEDAIKTALYRIFKTTGARNRAHAVAIALRHRWLDQHPTPGPSNTPPAINTPTGYATIPRIG